MFNVKCNICCNLLQLCDTLHRCNNCCTIRQFLLFLLHWLQLIIGALGATRWRNRWALAHFAALMSRCHTFVHVHHFDRRHSCYISGMHTIWSAGTCNAHKVFRAVTMAVYNNCEAPIKEVFIIIKKHPPQPFSPFLMYCSTSVWRQCCSGMHLSCLHVYIYHLYVGKDSCAY